MSNLELIVKSEGFSIHGYQVPKFEFRSGELLRIWVQIIPVEKGLGGYKFSRHLKNIIRAKNNIQELWVKDKFPIANNNPYNRLQSHYLTVDRFLKNGKISDDECRKVKDFLRIKGDTKISDLYGGPLRILSMLRALEKSDCIVFDYYGVDAHGTDQMDKWILQKLAEGKSAIGFDNLYYLNEEKRFPQEKHIHVRRIKP